MIKSLCLLVKVLSWITYHDFKIEPDSSKVMIYASDIESITVSDPELE